MDLHSMKNPSLVLKAPKQVTIEDRPLPTIAHPHDVLIEVAATGICGSDLHYYNHGKIGAYELKAPMVLGHESAGVVTAIGPLVTTLKLGDRIALEPGVPCRYCPSCASGRYNLCAAMRFAATPPYDGTLCAVWRLPEDFCHRVPAHVSFEEAAMAEPLSVAVHAMRTQGAVQVDDRVALGAAVVVAVDVNAARLRFAREFAATHTCDAKILDKDPKGAAREIIVKNGIGERGADVVVDASGAESSVQVGIYSLRSGGTFVQAGMGNDNVVFPIAAVSGKELSVKGTFRYGPGDYKTAIHLMATGKVEVAKLITDVVPFSKAVDVYRGSGDANMPLGIKTVIRGPSFSGGF